MSCKAANQFDMLTSYYSLISASLVFLKSKLSFSTFSAGRLLTDCLSLCPDNPQAVVSVTAGPSERLDISYT